MKFYEAMRLRVLQMSEGKKTEIILLDDRRLEILIQVGCRGFWILIT